MSNQETEGVIKYQLHYQSAGTVAGDWFETLNRWRQVLFCVGLIGQCSERYGGLGYGNVSAKSSETQQFVISGTQTSGVAKACRDHYVLVEACEPQRNRVAAIGPVAPSSEALTHAAVYQADPRIGWVLHVHCPVIWGFRQRLGLLQTGAKVPYGTPLMAAEMSQRVRQLGPNGIIAMAGHEDGIVAYGDDLALCGQQLLALYVRAVEMKYQRK